VGPTLGEGHVVGLWVPHDGRPSMMFYDNYRFGHYVVRLNPSLVNCDQIQQFVTVELTTMTKFEYRHRKNNLL
jgi:hypothetical protein